MATVPPNRERFPICQQNWQFYLTLQRQGFKSVKVLITHQTSTWVSPCKSESKVWFSWISTITAIYSTQKFICLVSYDPIVSQIVPQQQVQHCLQFDDELCGKVFSSPESQWFQTHSCTPQGKIEGKVTTNFWYTHLPICRKNIYQNESYERQTPCGEQKLECYENS